MTNPCSAGAIPSNGPGFNRTRAKGLSIEKAIGGDRRKRHYGVDPDPVPEYVEGHSYSKYDLGRMADELLDGTHLLGHPVILTERQLKSRHKREIYNKNGVPDPSITSGIYWRTHPDGRTWNTPEEMAANAASFYR